MVAIVPLRLAPATLLLSAWIAPATADVRIALAGDLEPGRHFLVTTQIYQRGLERLQTQPLGSFFLTAGQSANVAVRAVNPLVFDHVLSHAQHPAYATASSRSDAAPHLLRTVAPPALRPQSWRQLLDRREPPAGRDGASVAFVVGQHFDTFLRDYLPAFDRARIDEDLRQHLPLLQELAAFAHRERTFAIAARTARPDPGPLPRPDEPPAATLERQRAEMDQRLDEIRAWLALDRGRRAPLHDWMARFHRAEDVYRTIMTDADRARLVQWLNRSLDGGAESNLQWDSATTGARYAANRGSRVSRESAQGYEVELTVDLNPILGLQNNPRYLRKSSAGFYRDDRRVWSVR